MNFSTSEIASKKVRRNDADFSTIEITSKKYVEMTWKFVEIKSSTYRRGFDVVYPFGSLQYTEAAIHRCSQEKVF